MNNTKNVIKIVAFAGSIRQASANAGLIRAAEQLCGSIANVEFQDITDLIGQLPLYDSDLESEDGFTGAVKKWREAIRSADALLIATPEYNYSLPGVLKNAIDWASRPDDNTYSSFPTFDKPVAIMGAGGGMGTSRAQYHLRQVGVYLNWHFVNKPEVNVNLWGGKQITNDEGDITDDATRGQVKALLEALVDWTKRLNTAKFAAVDVRQTAKMSKAELKVALKEVRKREKSEKKAHMKKVART